MKKKSKRPTVVSHGKILQMASHTDPLVRCTAAENISIDLLPGMMSDPDWRVRREVAMRAPPALLPEMMLDPSLAVLEEVAMRIDRKYLSCMVLRCQDPWIRDTLEMRLSGLLG